MKSMKKLNDNYLDCYYLTQKGLVFNADTNSYLKPDKKHKFKLRQKDNKYKTVYQRQLFEKTYNKHFCIDNIEDLEGEEWKYIDDTDQYYLVSSCGRVKSLKKYNAIILKPTITKQGYQRVDIIINNRRYSKLVHRLVANYFLQQPKHFDYHVHHIDFKRRNNKIDNLQWLSPEEHREKHGKKDKNNVSTKSEENIDIENQ